jgi:hypothetical protein
MRILSKYEANALSNIQPENKWLAVRDIGYCRLSTLNKLYEKGYLKRMMRPGKYNPNNSIMFMKERVALSLAASA